MRSRLLAVLVGSGLAATALAFPAHASAPVNAGSIRFSISLSTHRLRYGSEATLSIRMRTGAHGQTAGIGLNSSVWPDRNVLGSPIAFGGPRISGPGRITGGFGTDGGGRGPGPVCGRGPLNTGGGGQEISLPPNSVTVIRYPVGLSAPPWPGLRPTVSAWAYVPAMGPGSHTYQLGSRRLDTAGATGVRISLAATRGITRTNRYGEPVAQPGARVLIAGSTTPRVAGAHLRVLTRSYRSEPPHRTRVSIGSAVTSSDGSFHIWWHPPGPGAYMIVARLPHPGPGYLPDRGCDLSITVR